uniref:Histone deacetylase n=1 Tax=Panagrellus redivivus TaxID=6233 RepID=A0A7E4VMQ1_PANRE
MRIVPNLDLNFDFCWIKRGFSAMVKIPSRWHPEKKTDDEADKSDEKPDTKDDVIGRKRNIMYFHNENVAAFHYGPHHPMKPFRLAVTHSLILHYNLQHYFTMVEPPPATYEEIIAFHDTDYIEELMAGKWRVVPDEDAVDGTADDVPLFDGVYDYCTYYTGSTIQAAKALNCKWADIVINWSGGLHHAKKAQASGFCYVNDIVIGILELLKHNQRVLYIDIDIHHGDGVQDAFYFTSRVMTASFHHYHEKFFPGTGIVKEKGRSDGKHYSLNFPLREGITDESYAYVFKPIVRSLVKFYDPNVIVLQCGADSLGSDKLGKFNLSFNGHGECIRFVKSLNRPLMILGGGGYRLRNVARCWTNETAIIVGQDDVISDIIPEIDPYRKCFAPEHYKLRPELPHRFRDANTREFLDYLIGVAEERMRKIEHAPSVQMQPLGLIEETLIEFMRRTTKERRLAEELKAQEALLLKKPDIVNEYK